MTFQIIKWIHVLFAISALGANITYGIWISRASKNPDVLPFTLRNVKLIDDRVANPAYILLLISGLLMVWLTDFPLTVPWLLISLIIYTGLALIGFLAYTPTLKRQIELAEQKKIDSAEYQQVARRATVLGGVLVLFAVVIVFMMVVKPALWA